MPRIRYEPKNFNATHAAIIAAAADIVATYRAQGYVLTLRQIYYQFVARDLFPPEWADPATGSTNNERSYKKLGSILADARMAGELDWSAIEDRTREAGGNNHWDGPADIVRACAGQFMIDKWEDQTHRVEVWVEKDALEGVVERAARALDITYFSCRGYVSLSSIWEAGQRLKRHAAAGQTPVILHLGDHDPSGIDMSRDVEDRLRTFMRPHGAMLEFKRIALNMDQIDQYGPPPNPAKVTDSRFRGYQDLFGEECWELDALEPSVIDQLIRDEVAHYRDDEKYAAREELEGRHKERLARVADELEVEDEDV